MPLRGRDDDGARRLVGAIEHGRFPVFRIQLHGVVGNQPRLVADVGFLGEARRDRNQQPGGGEQGPDQGAKLRHSELSSWRLRQIMEPSNLSGNLMASFGHATPYTWYFWHSSRVIHA